MFFVEEDRHVRADNTFSFKAVRFEAPRHLPERTIQVRFQRKHPTRRVVVYYKGERMGEARPLDPVANDRPPRGSGQADPPPRRPQSDPGDAAGALPATPSNPPPAPTGAAAQNTPNSELSTSHSL